MKRTASPSLWTYDDSPYKVRRVENETYPVELQRLESSVSESEDYEPIGMGYDHYYKRQRYSTHDVEEKIGHLDNGIISKEESDLLKSVYLFRLPKLRRFQVISRKSQKKNDLRFSRVQEIATVDDNLVRTILLMSCIFPIELAKIIGLSIYYNNNIDLVRKLQDVVFIRTHYENYGHIKIKSPLIKSYGLNYSLEETKFISFVEDLIWTKPYFDLNELTINF